jgi:hypothetical protein
MIQAHFDMYFSERIESDILEVNPPIHKSNLYLQPQNKYLSWALQQKKFQNCTEKIDKCSVLGPACALELLIVGGIEVEDCQCCTFKKWNFLPK